VDQPTEYGPMPVLLGMLLCDHVIVEQGTSKKSLIGIFDRVFANVFPTFQQMTVYVRLIDAQGAYKFKLDFVDIERDTVIRSMETELMHIADRFEAYELIIRSTVQLQRAGLHEFRLFANEAFIGSISFRVIPGDIASGR